MKQLILFAFVLLCGTSAFGQIGLTEDFEDAFNNGWTSTSTFNISTTQNCVGQSFRENVWSNNQSSFLQSPTVSNTTADEVSITFSYKVANFAASTPASPYDGTVTFGYILNGGAVQTLGTLSPQGPCATATFSIPAGTLSAGDMIAFRYDMTWGSVGDWDLVVDDFSAAQSGACLPPTATYTIVDDCDNSQFSVDVNVTDLGSASSTVTISDDQSSTPQTISAAGTVTFGPFADGASVVFTVADGNDASCAATSGAQTFTCPLPGEVCSGALPIATLPFTTTDNTSNYGDDESGSPGADCGSTSPYLNGDDVFYAFTPTASGDHTISLTGLSDNYAGVFLYGSCADVGTNCLDGDTNGFSSADLLIIANLTAGEEYIIAISTWASPQSTAYTLTVEENGCTAATASLAVAEDCDNSGGFFIEAAVTDFGTATTITVTNDQDASTQTITAASPNALIGPFINGAQVNVTLTPDDNADCTLVGGPLTQVACPPANDECADAVSLTVNNDLACGTTTSGTIAGATNSGEDNCGGTEDDDVWYSFVATATEHQVSLTNVSGGTTDLYHAVYSGTCGSLVSLTCSDPNTSVTSGLTVGETYIVQVYSWTSTAGQTSSFDICIGTLPSAPDNDECADAVALTVNADLACGTTTAGTIASATDSGEDNCGGTEDDDVWYSFVATATEHQVSLTNVSGSTTDLYHAVYSGTCGSLVSLTCSDPNTSITSGLTVGETYIVQVYSWTSAAGQTSSFDICIGTPPAPPANDDCADAIALTDATGMPTDANGMTYTSLSASNSGESSCSNGTADDDVWFTVTAPLGEGDVITITVEGAATFDGVIGLFSGSCGNLVQVGSCVDGTGSGGTEVLRYVVPAAAGFAASAAETFYVQVYDFSSGAGDDFTVNAIVTSILPVDLTTFTGQAMEKANKLNWATASEDGASHYVVERAATNTGNWAAIAEVAAAGNTTRETRYEMMDEQPLPSALYRLRIVDLDGSEEFSPIVRLENGSVLTNQLTVAPVPTNGDVTLRFRAEATGAATIALTDLTGRTISQRAVTVTEGLQTQTVSLADVASGIYLVRVLVDGRQYVQRVVRR